MFNKKILQAYATKYGFKLEDVEAKCEQMVEILVRYKFFTKEDAIDFIEKGITV